MTAQRDMIVRAAWDCLVEKGLSNTTVRDICVRAGISMGALYHHFKDRTEVLFAARVAHYDQNYGPPAMSWAEYIGAFTQVPAQLTDPETARRMRLSYEFLAEFTQLDANPSGVDEIVDNLLYEFRTPLAAAYAAGEISLPLGLERTADLHMRLILGTQQRFFADRRLDPVAVTEDLVKGLGVLAGLKTDAKPKQRKAAD